MGNRPAYLRLRQWQLWLSGLVGSRYDGLDHFAVVEPGVLLRCGQPRVGDLERIRRQHGLQTVVCARGGTRHPLRGRWFRLERRYCERNGIHLEHMPFSDSRGVPAGLFDRFLRIVADAEKRPVLVHCEQGFHRTGVLVAAYRVAQCGWSFERAAREMEAGGFELRTKRAPLVQVLQAWATERHDPEATQVKLPGIAGVD